MDNIETNNSSVESGISLSEIWRIIKKNIIVIFIMTVLCGIFGGAYAYGVAKPTYSSSGKILVVAKDDTNENTNNIANQNTAVSLSIKIAATVTDIIKDEVITKEVAKKVYDDEKKFGAISSGVSTSYETTQFLIFISYTTTDKENCKLIVQELIQATIDYANSEGAYVDYPENTILKNSIRSVGLENKLDENGEAIIEDGKTKLVPAASAARYTSPNKRLITIIGAVLGIVLGVAIAFVKEMCSDKIQGKKEIESRLNIKVIGLIPDFHSSMELTSKYSNLKAGGKK